MSSQKFSQTSFSFFNLEVKTLDWPLPPALNVILTFVEEHDPFSKSRHSIHYYWLTYLVRWWVGSHLLTNLILILIASLSISFSTKISNKKGKWPRYQQIVSSPDQKWQKSEDDEKSWSELTIIREWWACWRSSRREGPPPDTEVSKYHLFQHHCHIFYHIYYKDDCNQPRC